MITVSLKTSLLIGVIAVIVIYTDVFQNFYTPRSAGKRPSEKAQQQATKKRAEIEKAMLKQEAVIMGEECSPTSDICYTILDEVKRVEGKVEARRMMRIKDTRVIFTVMKLQVPEIATWDNIKTKDWPILKMVVPAEYIQMQIAIGFITEALAYEFMMKQQVLIIGLGGGSASSFFSILDNLDIGIETTVVEVDPFMVQLAEKYFQHQTIDGITNVIVQDGLKFLDEAAGKGKKYRSILIDACYASDETLTGLFCPIREFLTEKVIQRLDDVLEDGGVISVNLLSLKNTAAHEGEALQMFKKVFPSCFLAPYQRARNMLVCSKRKNWTWENQKNRFNKNLASVVERFDFQLLKNLNDYYSKDSPKELGEE